MKTSGKLLIELVFIWDNLINHPILCSYLVILAFLRVWIALNYNPPTKLSWKLYVYSFSNLKKTVKLFSKSQLFFFFRSHLQSTSFTFCFVLVRSMKATMTTTGQITFRSQFFVAIRFSSGNLSHGIKQQLSTNKYFQKNCFIIKY